MFDYRIPRIERGKMVDKVRPRLGLWGGCAQEWPSGNAG